MGNMVEDTQLPYIKRAVSARDAWIKLCKHHRKSTFSSKIQLLKKLYHAILPKHGNMEDHLSKLIEYYDEQQFVSIVLTSVGEDYDHFELTLDMVKCKLLDEYDRQAKTENKEQSVLKVQSMKFCDFSVSDN